MSIAYAHLLIADNDEVRCRSLKQPLIKWGFYQVTTVATMSEALTACTHDHFDLVIIDIDLASQDEFRFLQEISIATHLLPVIIITSADKMTQTTQCIAQGASDYLLYPTNETLLQARVSAGLQSKQLQEQADSFLRAFDEMKKLADDLRHIILPLGIALSNEKNYARLLERIVIEAKNICNADAGTLYLRTPDNQLRFAIMRTASLNLALGGTTNNPISYPTLPIYDPETGEPNHHNVATHVLLEGQSVNIPNVYDAEGFDFSGAKALDAQTNYRTISCLTVPLKNHEVHGVLQLLNAQDPETGEIIPFDSYHQLVAESLGSQAAVIMHNHRLRQREETLLRYERELMVARQIQAGFFPRTLPQPPGWELAACFHSARQVAGDFYDAFNLPGEKIGLVIADVCDKGVVAALFMALIRSLIRAFVQQRYYDVGTEKPVPALAMAERPFQSIDMTALIDAIRLTNTYLGSHHGQTHMFATVFMGILNPATGQLVYINGGHNPPLILNNNGIKTQLNPTGPAIGLRPDAIFRVYETHLAPGDTLFAYTDGITEARNPIGEFFTKQRLFNLLATPSSTAHILLQQIENAVQQHMADAQPSDDITILVARRQLDEEADSF